MWVVFGLDFPVRKNRKREEEKSKEVLDCYWSIWSIFKYVSKIIINVLGYRGTCGLTCSQTLSTSFPPFHLSSLTLFVNLLYSIIGKLAILE